MKLAQLVAREAGVSIKHVMLLRHSSAILRPLLSRGGTVEDYTIVQPIGSKYDYRDPSKLPVEVVVVILDDRVEAVYRVLGVEKEGSTFDLETDLQRELNVARGRPSRPARRFALERLQSAATGHKIAGWEARQRTTVQRSDGKFFDEIEVSLSEERSDDRPGAVEVINKTSSRLVEGQIYTRLELRSLFGITDATINNGIFRPKGWDSVWLFITENKTPDRTQFEDRLDGDTLSMQGQTQGRTDSLIVGHRSKGLELLLFYRSDKAQFSGGGFRYEGAFDYQSHSGDAPTSFVLKRSRSERSYKYGERRTWELAVDAVVELGGSASAADILQQIVRHTPQFAPGNLSSDLSMLAVNSPSRGQYGNNTKPRRTDAGHEVDKLFKLGHGTGAIYQLYEPAEHGVWELYLGRGTTLDVRLVNEGPIDHALADAEERIGDFDPANIEDARDRVFLAIVQRRGQPEFRQALIAAYGGRCALTGCALVQVLEAAHIHPYKGRHTNVVPNGLLLRSDIHTLFDLGLLRIDADTLTVRVSSKLEGTEYSQLEGVVVTLPEAAEHKPSADALRWHSDRSIAW